MKAYNHQLENLNKKAENKDLRVTLAAKEGELQTLRKQVRPHECQNEPVTG